MSPKLVRTYPHLVENQEITMAPLMNEMQLNYDKNQNMESGNEAEAPQPATFRHKKWCNKT